VRGRQVCACAFLHIPVWCAKAGRQVGVVVQCGRGVCVCVCGSVVWQCVCVCVCVCVVVCVVGGV